MQTPRAIDLRRDNVVEFARRATSPFAAMARSPGREGGARLSALHRHGAS